MKPVSYGRFGASGMPLLPLPPTTLAIGAMIFPSVTDGTVLLSSFAPHAQYGTCRQKSENGEQKNKEPRISNDTLKHGKMQTKEC